jgi:hypothetical protein
MGGARVKRRLAKRMKRVKIRKMNSMLKTNFRFLSFSNNSLLKLIRVWMDEKNKIERRERKTHLLRSPKNPKIVVKIEIVVMPIEREKTIFSRISISNFKILRMNLPKPRREREIIAKRNISGRISTM